MDLLTAASLGRLSVSTENGQEQARRANVRFHLSNLPRLTARVNQVQALRKAILALAIRGMLVAQDPSDGDATALMERILAERCQVRPKRGHGFLAEAGRDSGESLPFPLPHGWLWVRFGDLILDADSGWSPKTEGLPRSGDNWGVLKVSAVSWGEFRPEENKQLLPGVVPPSSAVIKAGDFLISRANTAALVAKSVVVEVQPNKLILSDKIVRLRLSSYCDKKFFCMLNNYADYARTYYAAEASGTSLSMKNVSRAVIYALPVPLPPFNEQCRIVNRVEVLMTICDRLEAGLAATEDDRKRLLEVLLREAIEPNVSVEVQV